MNKKVLHITADDLKGFSGDFKKKLGDLYPKQNILTEPQKQMQREKLKKTEGLAKKFMLILEAEGLPKPVQELMFHPTRKWKFDFAWPDHKIALEVEGGIWIQGGHSRGKGYKKDMSKYNQAAVLGWTVLRCVPDELINQTTLLKTILINKNNGKKTEESSGS